MPQKGFLKRERKLRPGVIVLLVLLHIAALYGLTRALAPDFTQAIERNVVETFTVTITAPPEDPEIPEEGMQGDPGKDAVPQPVSAPTPRIPPAKPRDLPQAASTGDANTAGATNDGDGTGASGEGDGTGSGDEGSGRGSTMASKPVLIRSITDASAFPIPPGGRKARIGESVIVRLMVSAQGRVARCSIYRASPFPETDAAVCELAYDQIRFEPARDSNGDPVAEVFYYQQRFFN
ncbi:MAG: TonB family protein [Altererythrobacter sp.]|nr:TonB family protein [Altererythrobacter sp.]